MNDSIGLLLISAVTSVAGFIFAIYKDKPRKSKDDDFVIKNKKGKKELISIPNKLSKEDIRLKILESINFENEIEKHISNIKNTKNEIQFDHGKYVDFIIHSKGKKIGIESKINLNEKNIELLEKYKINNEDINKLYVIYKTSKIKEKHLEEIKNKNKNIEFLKFKDSKDFKKFLMEVM